MTNEKPKLKELLQNASGKKLLFLGKEGIFTEKEIMRFLKPYKISLTHLLEEDVVGVVEHHRLNPVEEDISYEAYERNLPIYKLNEFEELLSEEIDDDALLMAIKLGNDQERVVRLLGNEHLSDTLFVRLLKLYRFSDEEDDRQDRDVIMYTLRRYIDIKPNEEDLLYSYLTLRRLATEATDSDLLDALLNFPNFEFLIRGKEKVTLRETIARNPHIGEDLVRKLLGYRDEKVDIALAGNNAVSKEVLHRLYEKGNDAIYRALAVNSNIDNALFHALLDKEEETVSLLVLRQTVDTERFRLLKEVSLERSYYVVLGMNENLDRSVVRELIEEGCVEVLVSLASNASIGTDMAERIYQTDKHEVFMGLAQNPVTPVWILEALFEEYAGDVEMEAALARNSALPEAKLRTLFERDNFEINKALATNDALPSDLLDILKLDTRLQHELAQNEQLARSYEEVLNQRKVMLNV